MKKKCLYLTLFCGVALTSGCSSVASNPRDPYEPFNRTVFKFNDKIDRAVAKPVAQAYRAATPQPVRTGINNFFDNLLDAYSVANDILSVQPVKAMNDLMRFAINSTFGVLGLVDFATPMGLKSNKTTLGDTFARWGWKQSNYLVLPLLGPSTVRDGLGTVTTIALSPDRRVVYRQPDIANSAWGLNLVSKRERYLDITDTVDEAALDPYSYTRDAFLQLRNAQVYGNKAASSPAANSPDDNINIDELVPPTEPNAPQKNEASKPQ